MQIVNIHKAYDIKYVTSIDDSRIKYFVENCESSSVYHLPEWCGLINRVFNNESYYFYAESNSKEIIGVLPLVRLKSHIFGDYLISMPYFNYGGAIAKNADIENNLINVATNFANENGINHIEFRDCKMRSNQLPVRTDKVSMIMDLPCDIDSLGKTIGSKRRSQIKRPIREGAEKLIGGHELIDEFYEVFSTNMRDLGTPVYGKKFFIEILDTFPEIARIVLIRIKGKAAASGFLMGYHDKLEIPWASTKRQYNPYSVNMLLYWEVLKYAIEHDYKKFDFGRSTINSGTYRFKKQWGAKPLQLYWYYWLRDGQTMPNLTTSNPKYQLAIKTWQHLPLFITNYIGPKIVKNLP